MTELNIDNTAKWNSSDLPIGSYFIVENSKEHEGKIFLKTYGAKFVNILNGRETFGSQVTFLDCVLINKLKILIEQL